MGKLFVKRSQTTFARMLLRKCRLRRLIQSVQRSLSKYAWTKRCLSALRARSKCVVLLMKLNVIDELMVLSETLNFVETYFNPSFLVVTKSVLIIGVGRLMSVV